ncbi:unnamed protein product [Echinostoma caproni]|uniref:C2 domain-containing protein n=1 Tax=Echinostoma caproni TaxID=27848 RepID=A0A183AJS8_9TREM|nr:unnamed protein product [Echinostoma caproni]
MKRQQSMPPTTRNNVDPELPELVEEAEVIPEVVTKTAAAPITERVTWHNSSRTEPDGMNRKSIPGQKMGVHFEKSSTLPLKNSNDGNEEKRKSRLSRQVTLQDSPEVFSESEDLGQVNGGHKLRKHRLKRHSISLSRINSYDSTNEVEASYQKHAEISGDLEVSLDYDSANSRLAVMVWGARNIAAVDKKAGTSHPYAKVYLYPDPANKTERKIHCKGHTCSPSFNQGVCYSVSPSELFEKTLVVELWHRRKGRGSKTFLGEITVPLRNHKWDNTERTRLALEQKHSPTTPIMEPAYRGDLKVRLKFSMSQNHRFISQLNAGATNFPGTLEVTVQEAKNLMSTSTGPNVSAFVRGEIRADHLHFDPQQTDVVPKTSHPAWNTVFRFPDLTQNDLRVIELQLSLWHRTGLTKAPQLLGGVRLSYKPGR